MRVCHEGPVEMSENLLQKFIDTFISAKDRNIKID